MKNLILSAFAAIILTGCGTTSDRTRTSLSILKMSACTAATVAAIDNPANKAKLQLIVVGLDSVIGGTNYAPAVLLEKLAPSIRELNDPRVAVAASGILQLYTQMHTDYISNKLNEHETAKLFLQALRDGAACGAQ